MVINYYFHCACWHKYCCVLPLYGRGYLASRVSFLEVIGEKTGKELYCAYLGVYGRKATEELMEE